MGLNEFAGYFAAALTAWGTGYIAGAYGLRPEPFYLGVAFVIAGLSRSIFMVRKALSHVHHETAIHAGSAKVALSECEIFTLTTLRDRNLSAATGRIRGAAET
jgi:hypothetical protein